MRDLFRPGRSPMLAPNAAIATSHPLSTSAGLQVLREGGNAVDAALAAVAVQAVVDTHMTGIGGDCFALYAPAGGEVVAINGSGRAPAGATVARLRELGLTEIAQTSPHAVTVPGAISAWMKLHGDHGSLPLDRLFRDAIHYAENGYPVSPRVAHDWACQAELLAKDEGAAQFLLKDGRAPRVGETHAQPKLGARLREIAQHGARAFYTGAVAESMVARLRALGGLHTLDDFAAGMDSAIYCTPISTGYRGYEVVECPPNGQGVAALMIMNILGGFELPASMPLAERIHLHAEATKLAYHHRDALIADPAHLPHPVETLLSDETTAILRRRLSRERAGVATLWHEPEHQDTIYLCVVDRDGNAISFINSIFHAFGSTRLDPVSGVLLHSRGASFRLIEDHPNAIAPGKRPMHTIIPGMLRKDGRTVMPFGVMGGHYQAAGHAAFLSGMLDQGLDVQEAIDAPRAFSFDGMLEVEPTVDTGTLERLTALGHRVEIVGSPIGGAQAIWIDQATGTLWGGSDPRKDGMALGY
ncbi:MAG TPA: gamma-glutamyltransferase family protein [Geminicoccus sp.]|uniref:gamma-glutamyltransferase family protein n=1 Tax=Geminicoccus sp. TaxID=2024832 RepID=UPI002C44F864|nr:gamma-glutamyltransferase family protein [Geminicoccus sp.]HWL68467.1 gamma-glutamyltransferase family protein [Geminicoccus sp.]